MPRHELRSAEQTPPWNLSERPAGLLDRKIAGQPEQRDLPREPHEYPRENSR